MKRRGQRAEVTVKYPGDEPGAEQHGDGGREILGSNWTHRTMMTETPPKQFTAVPPLMLNAAGPQR